MTERDIVGLVEQLKSTAEALRRKRVDITLGNRFVLINICEQAAAALTELEGNVFNLQRIIELRDQRIISLEAERDGMRDKTIDECAKVAADRPRKDAVMTPTTSSLGRERRT